MLSNQIISKLTGLLLLSMFIIGVIVYQILQGPVLFSDSFLTSTSENSQNIITSVLLLFFNGLGSIFVAILLFPIFKQYNLYLAILYIVSTTLSFVAISIDNFSVLSLLELSKTYTSGAENVDLLKSMGVVYYKNHCWTHYISMLISCFPVFILYLTFFLSKLIPRIFSIIGLTAAILMFIEILASILGNSISMNMLMPIGLIQLILPFWLIFKGLNSANSN